jgi:NADPH:quinone reductase-like Zn-dependent oxidoreductase
MKAVGFTEFGGPEVLKTLDVVEPHAGVGQVRVKVEAFDVTPANTYLRSGEWEVWEEATANWEGAPKFAPDLAYYIPGWDFSGTVDEVGAGTDATVGDRVVGLPIDPYINGPYAQLIVTSAHSVVRAPAKTDNVAAATFLMNALTAYAALEALSLAAGSTVAVTGAAGALGQYVIELGKHYGLGVIADAKPADEALVRGLGADHVVARGDDVAQRIREVAPNGVDGLIDCAALHERIVPAVRDGGAIATPRWYSGPNERGITWHPVNVSRHTTRHNVLEELRDLVEAGVLSTPVAETLPAHQAALAHRKLEAGGVRGRIVLTW